MDGRRPVHDTGSRRARARRLGGALLVAVALVACAVVLATSLGLALALTPRMGHSAFANAGDDASAALLVEAADSGDLHEVRRLLDSPSDRKIVRAIVSMAGDLELDVVVEGVETDAQVELLRELGCRLLQGYAFSRPRPAAEWVVGGC